MASAYTAETLGKYTECFALLGVVVAAYIAIKLLSSFSRGVWVYFVGPALGFSANLKKAGTWAVVTGCTDGIGKAFAQQIAQKGVNVVLISRTAAKLVDLAKEIESEYGVQTKVIAVDFTQGDEIYATIKAGLTGLDVGTLVNNVGTSYSHPEYFWNLKNREKVMMDIIHVNMTSVVMMTHLVLNDMLEKRRGYIINISSGSAEFPVPLLTAYSASKVHVDYFSKALHYECSRKGVTVQVIRPHFVTTKMSGLKRANMLIPSPTTFVKASLATLGLASSTNGFWAHSIQSFVAKYAPYSIITMPLLNARARSLQKIARQNKEQ